MKHFAGKFMYVCAIAIALILFAACNGGADTAGSGYDNEVIDFDPGDFRPPGGGGVIPAPNPVALYDEPVVINLTEAPEPEPSPWRTAEEMVAEMRVGWNLGNTLDAHPHGDANRFTASVSGHETMWGNPVTTRENIDTIAAAGFDVLRVPVTWYARMARGHDDYTIRLDWMDRVVEVVNWGLDAGMFVIVNTHHDEEIFSLWDEDMDNSKNVISRLWQQIGYVFRDHTHMLIFEGLNEPRSIGTPGEWNGGTAEERANVNILNQVFVDTVREIGGNNTNRMLMVPTYAASATVPEVFTEFILPTDPANTENKLIASLHMYTPLPFALSLDGPTDQWQEALYTDTEPIIEGLDLAYYHFISRGIPVIMGEMGALNRNNPVARANWTYFYVSESRARGIVCVWWDNGRIGRSFTRADGDHFGILNRQTNEFPFPEIIEALMDATE